jgi:hypothetical protein
MAMEKISQKILMMMMILMILGMNYLSKKEF